MMCQQCEFQRWQLITFPEEENLGSETNPMHKLFDLYFCLFGFCLHRDPFSHFPLFCTAWLSDWLFFAPSGGIFFWFFRGFVMHPCSVFPLPVSSTAWLVDSYFFSICRIVCLFLFFHVPFSYLPPSWLRNCLIYLYFDLFIFQRLDFLVHIYIFSVFLDDLFPTSSYLSTTAVLTVICIMTSFSRNQWTIYPFAPPHPPNTPPSPHWLYDLHDTLDNLMHFLPQLSDFVPLKNGFIGSAHTLTSITLLTLIATL